MTSLRFQRSTRAPAIGLNKIWGVKLKKATSARAVAWPVIWKAQIVRAKPVMDVPISESTWPIQMMVKLRMPLFDELNVFPLVMGLSR